MSVSIRSITDQEIKVDFGMMPLQQLKLLERLVNGFRAEPYPKEADRTLDGLGTYIAARTSQEVTVRQPSDYSLVFDVRVGDHVPTTVSEIRQMLTTAGIQVAGGNYRVSRAIGERAVGGVDPFGHHRARSGDVATAGHCVDPASVAYTDDDEIE